MSGANAGAARCSEVVRGVLANPMAAISSSESGRRLHDSRFHDREPSIDAIALRRKRTADEPASNAAPSPLD